jgi:hypothetical protein
VTGKTELAFFVVDSHPDWVVESDEFVYGPYVCFADALTAAIEEAQAAGLLGFASLVLARPGVALPFEARWIYGRDVYARRPEDGRSRVRGEPGGRAFPCLQRKPPCRPVR